jgi:hypothetical protein
MGATALQRGVLTVAPPFEKLTGGLPTGSLSLREACFEANRQSDTFTSLEIALRKFQPTFRTAPMEWAKATLNALEKSRNIVMHGGTLAKEDIERIGMNIRDWIRQAG